MKNDAFNAHNKYRVIKHAAKHNNIKQTCELFGISRTTYYKWLRAYEENGMNGLAVKEPKKPNMPNKVGKTLENMILDYVVKYPKDGPKRIYYELKADGYYLGETGIYNVLKRNQLTTQAKRLEYSKRNQGLKKYMNKIETNISLQIDRVQSPGQLVLQRLDYIGRYDGIGKVYQYTAIDVYSKWAAVKVFNQKREIDVWDFFEVKLVYLMKTFNINIEHLLTFKNKEFIPYFMGGERYKEIIQQFHFTHKYIQNDQRYLLDELDDFVVYCIKEFYSKLETLEHMDSFAKMDRMLQKFVRDYNFVRPIETGPQIGKIPAYIVLDEARKNKVDLDMLPLWMQALIHPIKDEGERNDKRQDR